MFLVKIVEVGLGLTVALFVGTEILKLMGLGVFDSFNPVLSDIVYFFGYDNTRVFLAILCGIFVIMAGRWVISWASDNGGVSANR